MDLDKVCAVDDPLTELPWLSMGREIFHNQKELGGKKTINFETTNWSAGVYFVNLHYNGKTKMKKLIISK